MGGGSDCLSDLALSPVPYGGRGRCPVLRGTQAYREVTWLPKTEAVQRPSGAWKMETVWPRTRHPMGLAHPALQGLPELPAGASIGPLDILGLCPAGPGADSGCRPSGCGAVACREALAGKARKG